MMVGAGAAAQTTIPTAAQDKASRYASECAELAAGRLTPETLS
jgi:hypothetical protein